MVRIGLVLSIAEIWTDWVGKENIQQSSVEREHLEGDESANGQGCQKRNSGAMVLPDL